MRIESIDGAQHDPAVRYMARNGADFVHGPCQCHASRAWDSAEGWPQSTDATPGARTHNGAEGFRTDGKRNDSGSHA